MFKIRLMAEKDRENVVGLINANFPHVSMTRGKLSARVASGSRFFIAEEGAEIAGFCELRIGIAALLHGIAVKSRFRGNGVGTALVEKCVLETRKSGMNSLWARVDARNEMAVRFYEGLGFAMKKETVGKAGKGLYVMQKGLEN